MTVENKVRMSTRAEDIKNVTGDASMQASKLSISGTFSACRVQARRRRAAAAGGRRLSSLAAELSACARRKTNVHYFKYGIS
jgi:hypothetical protein